MGAQFLPRPIADILVRRFYCQDMNGLRSPLYAIPLIEAAGITWVQAGKTRAIIFPRDKKLLELTRDQTELFEPYIRQINWCFTILRPITDPGLSTMEIRLLARIGITIGLIEKL